MQEQVYSSCSDEENFQQMKIEDIMKGPLNKRFYLTLINLENQVKLAIIWIQIKSKIFFSMQQVLDLVAMYGQCVEYFDIKRDPAKWYFMEKIAITLSESKTCNIPIKLLFNKIVEMILQKEKEHEQIRLEKMKTKPIIAEPNVKEHPLNRNPKPRISHQRINSSQQNSSHKNYDEDTLQANENLADSDVDIEGIKKYVQTENNENKISVNKFREVRHKKLTIIEQVHKEKDGLNHSDLVNEWDRDAVQKDNLIRASLEDQKQQFQDRLEKRKVQKKGLQSNSSYVSKSQQQFETL